MELSTLILISAYAGFMVGLVVGRRDRRKPVLSHRGSQQTLRELHRKSRGL